MDEILIIDDEVLITKTLKKLLEKEGFKVTVVSSGLDALQTIDQNKFHLIIADIRMPGIDGIETIRQMKESLIWKKDQDSPVIFITGYADDGARKRAEELGYASYIYKPFDLKVFLEMVKQSLRINKAQKE
jgi:CheY-like chemotaxis protein